MFMKRFNLFSVFSVLLVFLILTGCSSHSSEEIESKPTRSGFSEISDTTGKISDDAMEEISQVYVFETNVSSLNTINLDEAEVYSINDFINTFFSAVPKGNATVCGTDNYCVTVPAEEVLSYSLTLENDDGPVFVGTNITKRNQVKNMEYIAFANEVILFVEKDITMNVILSKLGMNMSIPYTFTAKDGFRWATLDDGGIDSMDTVLQVVDGTVNAVVPSLNKGSVRDVVFFVPGHTRGAASATVK